MMLSTVSPCSWSRPTAELVTCHLPVSGAVSSIQETCTSSLVWEDSIKLTSDSYRCSFGVLVMSCALSQPIVSTGAGVTALCAAMRSNVSFHLPLAISRLDGFRSCFGVLGLGAACAS